MQEVFTQLSTAINPMQICTVYLHWKLMFMVSPETGRVCACLNHIWSRIKYYLICVHEGLILTAFDSTEI